MCRIRAGERLMCRIRAGRGCVRGGGGGYCLNTLTGGGKEKRGGKQILKRGANWT